MDLVKKVKKKEYTCRVIEHWIYYRFVFFPSKGGVCARTCMWFEGEMGVNLFILVSENFSFEICRKERTQQHKNSKYFETAYPHAIGLSML